MLEFILAGLVFGGGGILLGVVLGIVLTVIVAARLRRAGEERLAARYAVPAQPGSIGASKLVERCVNAFLESKEFHAHCVRNLKESLPPTIGPLEAVEFKALHLNKITCNVSPLIYRENWPQEGYSALELGISIEGSLSLHCMGRLSGFAMAGKAGFEGAGAKGCVIMSPDRIAPLHFCLVETPQLRVFVNIPGAGTVINTAISTVLRYAIFPAGFRVPLPIPGTMYANATPAPVTSLYAPFVSVDMPAQSTEAELEEEEEDEEPINEARNNDMVPLESLGEGMADAPAAAEQVKLADSATRRRHKHKNKAENAEADEAPSEEGKKDETPAAAESELETLLVALGLAEHVATFKSRNVNIEQARQLSEADLKTMGLNMGARLRLKEALGPAGQKKSQ